eukprot:128010-Alexandrium_andersonii.AAC.1
MKTRACTDTDIDTGTNTSTGTDNRAHAHKHWHTCLLTHAVLPVSLEQQVCAIAQAYRGSTRSDTEGWQMHGRMDRRTDEQTQAGMHTDSGSKLVPAAIWDQLSMFGQPHLHRDVGRLV